ncbi:MAG: L-2-amino-thiazoline-4-carboxylic acid hydrolase [Candidatus Helarchaeota archaeon]
MSEDDLEKLPRNPIEAQGLLIKAVYKKYGKDVLPLIRDVLNRQGKALGLKIMRKLPNNNLSTIASAFSKSFDPAFVKVISLSDEKFHIQGTKCPFGLENTTRELCEAVMEIDREYFYTATNGRTKLEILKTVAEGDSLCDTIYTIIKPED